MKLYNILNIYLSIQTLILITPIRAQWPIFKLFADKDKYTIVDTTNLNKSTFSYAKLSKFLVHGFGDNSNITKLHEVKNALFERNENMNLFLVDWGQGAAMPDYPKAAQNVVYVGLKIASFILNNKISPSNVHCIGHSLGAHVCGFAGKVMKLKRISGLDPAGPLFGSREPRERLDKDDAELVDVIHTDGWYGIEEAIGHQDYFPNGGKSQPGCGISFDIFNIGFGKRKRSVPELPRILGIDPVEIAGCSHFRVVYFYAESIRRNCDFKSVPCDTYDNFQKNKCKCDATLGCPIMGHDAHLNLHTGKFFLNTNKDKPYCMQ